MDNNNLLTRDGHTVNLIERSGDIEKVLLILLRGIQGIF